MTDGKVPVTEVTGSYPLLTTQVAPTPVVNVN